MTDGASDTGSGAARPPRSVRGPRFGLGAEGARSLSIAAVSTVVVFGLIGLVVVNAPGWPRFQQAFLNGPIFWDSLPKLVGKFLVNIQLFLIAELLIHCRAAREHICRRDGGDSKQARPMHSGFPLMLGEWNHPLYFH